ncbi:MAG: D-glycero-alpha-D-manno-heptose-1,7-bisphosphate 7-phosphatase [Oligoflexales bacterium]
MRRQSSGVPTIFLDRDGVLNEDKGYVVKPEDLRLLPGVVEGLKTLKNLGYRLVVITNQSGIARGYFSEREVEEFHEHMNRHLQQAGSVPIDAFYICPHHPKGTIPQYSSICECRKPGTGLVELALDEYAIDTSKSFFIGDKESDILCGKQMGLRTIHVVGRYEQNAQADYTVANFAEAVRMIISCSP